jgi:hypothetical protein
MPDLKLGKLPDRTPVKISFKAPPELVRTLNAYCDAYRAAYQQPDETVEELIPFMLAAFMDADPQFKKARKRAFGADQAGAPAIGLGRKRRRGPSVLSSDAAGASPNLEDSN